MSSSPSRSACFRKGSISKRCGTPSGPVTVWAARSIVTVAPGAAWKRLAKPGHGRRGQAHGQEAVPETVLVEDVAEARSDHGADAPARQRPHRALTRRAAAEVLRRHQDLRLSVRGLIQNELGVLRSVRPDPEVVEAELPVADAPRLPEEARRNDAVGVHVGQIERSRDAVEANETLHVS